MRITPGLISGRTIANGRTRVDVTFKPGAPTQVSWSMRDSAPTAAAREVRALADVLTLMTLGESDVRMAALVDVSVVQGQPRSFDVQLPAGYETISVTGNSLESSAQNGATLTLTLSNPAAARHQFLIVLEKAHAGGTFALETGFVTLPAVQRERGEIAITGAGTLELTAPARDGLTRVDVRELNPALQRLAREAIMSAFRYQGSPGNPPLLSLDVRRFDDAGVPAAIADRATATTLVTSEGRALTQIELVIQNRAQPFLRVVLPPKAVGRVGRRRGTAGETGARHRRHPRAAPAVRLQTARSLHGLVRLPPRRRTIRAKRRRAACAAAHGHPHQPGRMGDLRAGSVPHARDRRERHRSTRVSRLQQDPDSGERGDYPHERQLSGGASERSPGDQRGRTLISRAPCCPA